MTKTKKVESNLDEKLINRIINDTKKEINTPKKYSLVKEVMSN